MLNASKPKAPPSVGRTPSADANLTKQDPVFVRILSEKLHSAYNAKEITSILNELGPAIAEYLNKVSDKTWLRIKGFGKFHKVHLHEKKATTKEAFGKTINTKARPAMTGVTVSLDQTLKEDVANAAGAKNTPTSSPTKPLIPPKKPSSPPVRPASPTPKASLPLSSNPRVKSLARSKSRK